ncbi:uncharacterized protein LOC135110440 [Scylla paramamosain]|uniref:uncharacterized protein LOC135110440 n=1 Tax=Scylla paramamosain TaxID=85552 RepID=UPI003083889C
MSDEYSLPPFTPPPSYEEATSGIPLTLPPHDHPHVITPEAIALQALYNTRPQNNPPVTNTPVLTPQDIASQALYNAQPQNNPPVTNTPVLTPQDIASQALYNAQPQNNPPVTNTPVLTPQDIASQALYNAQPQNNPPVTNTPVQSPQAVASQALYNYQPQNNIPLYPRYDPCPTGAEVLRRLDEILVYPSKGYKYKIKNGNKVTIMTAKDESEVDCCNSCDCNSNRKFVLYSINKIAAAEAQIVIDAFNCCFYSPQHMDVMAPLSVRVGSVFVRSTTRCKVVNPSEDVLFSLERESDCCSMGPYQIFSASGTQVGVIDSSRGIKHRLVVSRDMPVRHKILLLFFALFLQREADSRRRS